jgi:hypothetical protein
MISFKVYYIKWDEDVLLTTVFTFREASSLVKALKEAGLDAFIEEKY